MAKLSTDELLDVFKEMTLIELSEFVKQFEDTFGVTAAAPVAMNPRLSNMSLSQTPANLMRARGLEIHSCFTTSAAPDA